MVSSRANPDILEEKLKDSSPLLLDSEIARAKKCIESLRYGAPTFLRNSLTACCVKNSSAALNHGPEVTDAIASWINKGFVAGPFLSPPTANFRANSILAVPQPGKVRICLNVSLPKGNSLNENIAKTHLEKVKMSSAKLFSFSILEAGRNCNMWKFDFEDAYKNIPVPINQLNVQGFRWLGRFFVELKQIFGAISSVQNFDIAGNTLKTISLANCEIPHRWVHRQLDDVPIVCKNNVDWGHAFAKSYRNICNETGFRLAPDCPKLDKAFSCSKTGKVLGVIFNTEDLAWKLPDDKVEKYLNCISSCLNKESVDLKEMQCLMGCLNHVAQMCPFLNCFKFNLNQTLTSLYVKDSLSMSLTNDAKKELSVWAACIADSSNWLPICHPAESPPLCTKLFVSDAAGFPKNGIWNGNIGCASLGLDEKENTFFAHQLWWNKPMITVKVDAKGVRFGDKTATLEQIGILLPLILIPEKLLNQHILFQTDNLACVFGHKNKLMKGDACASILIRAVHLISAVLGSVIHVEHIARCSSWESRMVDSMSRASTTGFLETHTLTRFTNLQLPVFFTDWISNPVENWDLAYSLLEHVRQKISQ